MKENFSNGIYPTLKERQDFALDCCRYVEERCQEMSQYIEGGNQKLGALISFSFVNNDLRDVFRGRFGHATWILLDTSEERANERIAKREDHFYQGKRHSSNPASTEADNTEWNFAPVTYPHIILNGEDEIETNARQVCNVFRRVLNEKDLC